MSGRQATTVREPSPRGQGPGRGAPGRRRVAREVRKPQMMEAAGRIFASRGYAATTMDEIARECRVSKPMLYAYFGSKAELFAACAEAAGEQLRERVRAAGEQRVLPPDERLWRGLLAVFDFADEHRGPWGILYPQHGEPAGPIGQRATSSRDAMADLLTELFAVTARELGIGEQAAEQTEAMAHAFTWATLGAVNWWLDRPGEVKELQALRLMNLFWVGFGEMAKGRLWLPP